MQDSQSLEQAKLFFLSGLKKLNGNDFNGAEIDFYSSLKFAPNRISTLINLSVVLIKSNKIKNAEKLIHEGSAHDPKNKDLLMGLIEIYKIIIKLNPQYAEVYVNLGNVYRELNMYEESLMAYNNAIKLKPNFAEVYSNRGNLMQDLRKFKEALDDYATAIKINPNHAEFYSNRGNVLKELFRYEEALENQNKAVDINPNYAEAYFNGGVILAELNRYEQALINYEKAIFINPNYAEAYHNRGVVFGELNQIDQALTSYAKAILLNPNYYESYCNRGIILSDFKLFEQALSCYEMAIALNPDYAEAYSSKSFILLRTGNLPIGCELYEWRWNVEKMKYLKPIFIQPLWLGSENLVGKTILLHAEQGLGDTIQFCRYAKLVQELGARVLLQVPKALMGLLKGLEGVDQLFAKGSELPEFDYQCPLMSLPLALKTTVETIPAPIPYILSDLGLQNKWRQHLGDEGFKVAICWQGSTKGKVDVGRSFPVGLFEGLSKIDGVRLISLQKNEGVEQLKNLPEGMRVETLPDNFDSGDNSFLDSAALMKCVDLVITSDTALTHLAGALGVKTWLPLKYVPDWRWMLDRSDSPWYPNHRLFRQTIRDDWASVFKEMEDEIKLLVSTN